MPSSTYAQAVCQKREGKQDPVMLIKYLLGLLQHFLGGLMQHHLRLIQHLLGLLLLLSRELSTVQKSFICSRPKV